MKPLKKYPYRGKIDGLSGDDIIVSAAGPTTIRVLREPDQQLHIFLTIRTDVSNFEIKNQGAYLSKRQIL